MTCCHFIHILYGIKIDKIELIKLFIELDYDIDIVKKYKDELSKFKKKSYELLYEHAKKNIEITETLEEYIDNLNNDKDSVEYLEEQCIFWEDSFIYDKNNNIDIYSFENKYLNIYENGPHGTDGYILGFYIEQKREGNTIMLDLEDLQDYEEKYKDNIIELDKCLAPGDNPTIMVTMNGCSCCS